MPYVLWQCDKCLRIFFTPDAKFCQFCGEKWPHPVASAEDLARAVDEGSD
jgi:rRNA maturation endonuclease Nob1